MYNPSHQYDFRRMLHVLLGITGTFAPDLESLLAPLSPRTIEETTCTQVSE